VIEERDRTVSVGWMSEEDAVERVRQLAEESEARELEKGGQEKDWSAGSALFEMVCAVTRGSARTRAKAGTRAREAREGREEI